jgi:hypothetical protein
MASPGEVLWRLGAAALLLCAGCASADLSKDADIRRQVVECLPTDAPVPDAVVRAIWFPNSRGFESSDASPMGHVSGVLALAGDRLWFMTWNEPERHFDMVHVVAVLQAEQVRVDRLGTSAVLVVQSRNLSFDSFEPMKESQIASDPQATEDLLERIQALRARNPQPDP